MTPFHIQTNESRYSLSLSHTHTHTLSLSLRLHLRTILAHPLPITPHVSRFLCGEKKKKSFILLS